MLTAHGTQQRVLGSFKTKTGRVRPISPCDFRKLPSEVLYAHYDWGLQPSDWPDLVDKASRELELPQWL